MQTAPSMPLKLDRLYIFDTHPIQYRAPLFRELSRRNSEIRVFLFNEQINSNRWWFAERGQIPAQNWKQELTKGYPVEILETDRRGILSTYFTLRKCLIKGSPTAILIFGYYTWENWMLLYLSRRFRIPVFFIGETFNDGFSKKRASIKNHLVNFFLSKISRFISVGEKNYQFYLNKGISKEKLIPGKYYVDESFFQVETGASNVRSEWRKKHGIPESITIMLFVGRLVDRKRPLDLAQIHKLVPFPNFYTVIAGNGYLEDKLQPYESERFRLIGFQDQSQVREAYHAADFLIVPSEFETWGLVVNEAALCGRPSLVTNTCGCAGDLVIPDDTGGIFNVGEVDAAAQIIRSWMDKPGHLKAMGERAQARTLRDFSLQKFADAVDTALTSL